MHRCAADDLPMRMLSRSLLSPQVLKHFSLWEGELEYIDALLEADVRNNSAWNQRHYVLRHSADVTDAAVVAREVDRALAIIARAPTNGSPWGFIKGLVEPIGYARFPQVRSLLYDPRLLRLQPRLPSLPPHPKAAPEGRRTRCRTRRRTRRRSRHRTRSALCVPPRTSCHVERSHPTVPSQSSC